RGRRARAARAGRAVGKSRATRWILARAGSRRGADGAGPGGASARRGAGRAPGRRPAARRCRLERGAARPGSGGRAGLSRAGLRAPRLSSGRLRHRAVPGGGGGASPSAGGPALRGGPRLGQLLSLQRPAQGPAAAGPLRALSAAVPETLQNLALGFSVALQPAMLFYAFAGCVIGTLVGVLPGVGPLAGISLLLPAT